MWPALFLVVDDDPLVLEVTAGMLGDLGCDVMTATSGHEALQQLSKDANIEILVTDINMASMDGYELAERARHRDAGLKGPIDQNGQ
jgi:CheY-like chemotaxis protein